MKNNRMRINIKYLMGKGNRMLIQEKKRLKRLGAIILATIVVASGILIIFQVRDNGPKLDNKPAKEIVIKDDKNNERRIFLERAEALKSGIYNVSYLVFGEEQMRITETVGESSKDMLTVQGDFKIKYSIDFGRMNVSYDFNKEKVILNIPRDAIGVDSVELIGDIKETYKYESFGNKVKKIIPQWNNDEELKELAIRQLMRNSKKESQKFNKHEVQQDAEKELDSLVRKLNFSDLEYEINFTDSKTIGIKK